MQQSYMNCSLLVEFSPTTCERFDFLLFFVTSFYCTLKILKITFPESGHSYLKVDIKERFIV